MGRGGPSPCRKEVVVGSCQLITLNRSGPTFVGSKCGAPASLRRNNVLLIARKCATRPILSPSYSTTVMPNE
jgi:hypothetical protein